MDSTNDELRCSFCNLAQSDVKSLIAGPSVQICDECVEVCNDIIADEKRKGKAPPIELPVEDREPSIFTVTRVRSALVAGPFPEGSHGLCHMEIAGIGQVTAWILDPTIEDVDNVYTRSLNWQTTLQIEAKAWRKRDKIARVAVLRAFVDDAPTS